ncbi:hypothetical protein HDU76_003117 [Blyttiomyces sp. JEL0837]|nr:hypothetical protein HDU76_003117 [Blyttiomyces sp. JEL0837]
MALVLEKGNSTLDNDSLDRPSSCPTANGDILVGKWGGNSARVLSSLFDILIGLAYFSIPLLLVKLAIAIISCFTAFAMYYTIPKAMSLPMLLEIEKQKSKQLAEKNEALSQARNEVKVAQAQQDFTSIMSHEMRTPLFAISSLTSLVLDMPILHSDDPSLQEAAKYLDVVKKSSEMLITIVNNVLDFAKYEDPKFDLDLKEFNVRRAFDMATKVATFNNHADAHPLVVTFFADNLPDIVVGDETRFKQILINLINNACKDPSKNKLYVTVRDTGVGIKLEDMDKIFQQFSQADTSTTRKYGGAGLGLSVAKQLCRMMGGDISVQHNPYSSVGTEFTFWVVFDAYTSSELKGQPPPDPTTKSPCLQHSSPESASGAIIHNKVNHAIGLPLFPTPTLSKLPLDDSLPKYNILVVEDNKINQLIIGKMLGKLGQQYDLVDDGVHALERLFAIDGGAVDKYDVLFMDIMMPRKDGYQTTQEIRDRTKNGVRPWIVGLSANAFWEDKLRAVDAGMNDFIIRIFPKSQAPSRCESRMGMRFQQQLLLQKQQLEQQDERDEKERYLGPVIETVNKHYAMAKAWHDPMQQSLERCQQKYRNMMSYNNATSKSNGLSTTPGADQHHQLTRDDASSASSSSIRSGIMGNMGMGSGRPPSRNEMSNVDQTIPSNVTQPSETARPPSRASLPIQATPPVHRVTDDRLLGGAAGLGQGLGLVGGLGRVGSGGVVGQLPGVTQQVQLQQQQRRQQGDANKRATQQQSRRGDDEDDLSDEDE